MNIQEQSAAAQEEQSPEWKSMTAPQVKSEPDIQMPRTTSITHSLLACRPALKEPDKPSP